MVKAFLWESVEQKYQSEDLYVIEVLFITDINDRKRDVAQLWKHDDGTYSLTTYEDEDQGNTNGNEHVGSYEELKEIAERIFQ